ncbi:MAG: DUF3368 domain-containing protein [Clostridia bacterium]|nr:DUF3368 domain-containing protein [Clostridia bacterium]
MLIVRNTENLAGVSISGDFYDLDKLVEALYTITIDELAKSKSYFTDAFDKNAIWDDTIAVSRGRNYIGSNELSKAVKDGNIKIYSVKDTVLVNRFTGKLHKGELEVITAARELGASYLLLDDKAARTLAETLLLESTGIIGLLKIAKLTGRIKSLQISLDRLIDYNFRISKALYLQLLKEVGEI